MNTKQLKQLGIGAAAAAAVFGAGVNANAQSADAIIDKLVEKGVLSAREAQDLRDEADKNFTQAYSVKSGMSDWVQALKFNGDIRGRYELFDSPNSAFTERQRLRYRMRFGVVAQLMDGFEVGFRLTSGEQTGGSSGNAGAFGGDPIAGNTTFSDNASKKFLYIDQAYGRWSPLNGPDFNGTFTIGKMENPFVFSDMVFDGDYTPEGLAASLGYTINSDHNLKLNLGYFVLDELSGNSHDPALLGAQVRWDANWTPELKTTLGLAYLDIENPSQLSSSAVPNINRGNTRTAPGALVYDYRPFIVDAAATYTLESFPMYNGAFPIKLMGDYMQNCGASGNSDNYGYSVGIQFGKSGKKGLWDVSYTWKWLGGDAMWEEFVDSDFGAYYQTAPVGGTSDYGSGTNVRGHIFKFAYSPSASLTLSAKWFLTELINKSPAGSESEMNRVQLDASWKF